MIVSLKCFFFFFTDLKRVKLKVDSFLLNQKVLLQLVLNFHIVFPKIQHVSFFVCFITSGFLKLFSVLILSAAYGRRTTLQYHGVHLCSG